MDLRVSQDLMVRKVIKEKPEHKDCLDIKDLEEKME